jgi:sorting nexin-1/2
MDILKTKYQKNKDKSDRMSAIMNEEITTFTREAHEQFRDLIRVFGEINT